MAALTHIAAAASFVAAAAMLAVAGQAGSTLWAGWPVFTVGIALAFLMQWVAFVPAYAARTEKYYDLTGSLTFLMVVGLGLSLGNQNARSILIASLVTIWAVRLGSFLFARIRRDGEDKRFEAIKSDFSSFLMTWTLQGLWVSMTLGAGLAAMTSSHPVAPGIIAAVGVVIWLAGFCIEVVADAQKSRFKNDPANAGKFIQSGLWRWSRHPNYFGEILVWTGIAIISLPQLQGWQLLTLISPLFVWALLTRISGIPMLEARAEQKWGADPAYQRYKRQTPQLVPNPFNNQPG